MSGPTNTAIIIGGGVIGLSTAYQLARRQFGRIILLEKAAVGDGASSRAGGIITGLLWTETGVAARQIALQLYAELSQELAPYGYQYQAVGCLNLFDNKGWPERESLLGLYDQQGVAYEIMNAATIMSHWPDLTVDDGVIGLFDPRGGYSEPQHYLPALSQRCRDLGVEIREGVLVEKLLEASGRATGVLTDSGRIEADVIFATVHVWSLQLLATLGWRLPIKSFVHQRYVSAPLPAPVAIPAINANPYGGYLRPAAGQRLLVGGETEERGEFIVPGLDYRMSGLAAPPGYAASLRAQMTPLMPRLAQTQWSSAEVGLLSFSVDGEPILGPAPHIENLFIGCAFHSGGFAYNPVAGLLLAELALDGRTSINIDSFAPARFDEHTTRAHLDKQLTQKDAVQRRH